MHVPILDVSPGIGVTHAELKLAEVEVCVEKTDYCCLFNAMHNYIKS